MTHTDSERRIASAYLEAKAQVIEAGYGFELDWQERMLPELVDARTFLREFTWVVLSSGMRSSVIADRFERVCQAFLDFEEPAEILDKSEDCLTAAMKVFSHLPKLSAVLEAVRLIDAMGFDSVRTRIKQEGPEWLTVLPFIGPATSLHLAKNIGFDVAKPDRHLLRICQSTGFSSPQELCEVISRITGDRIPLVDLVLWRYSAIDTGTCSLVFERRTDGTQKVG